MSALRALLLGCLLGGVFTPPAAGAEPAGLSADIGPRPLAEALTAFGRQTGLQVIYVSSVAETLQSKGAPAGLTAPAALTQLLDGTGLTFEFLNARTVRIFPAPTVVPTLTASSAVPPRHAKPLAPGLEEVLVTGTRGQEPLSRVPVDMTVWTEESMEASHVRGMAQLAGLTPGVGFAFSPGLGGDGYTHLDLRGVTSRYGATVGVYLDDIPIPPSRAATYLWSFPATFDLDRVEVLRGPQTVLLGDHTQAGAIRFVINQPSLTTSAGLVRGELGTTEYGAMSYEAGAAAGGPLATDVLGYRVSGWFREDGGYVDRVDPNTHAVDPNSNRRLIKVIRGALTFAPTASVQLAPSLMYQSQRMDDSSTFDPTVSNPARGVFRNPSHLRQPFEESYYLASLKLTTRLQAADLTALASYFDQSGFARILLDDPVVPTDFGLKQRTYSVEVRLSSSDPGVALTWIAGVFASSERARYPEWIDGALDTVDTKLSQLAGFGQVAGKLTQRLTATAGLRIGHSAYSANETPPSCPAAAASDTWQAPRVGLSWQADETDLVYLTVAKGYGSGGVYPINLCYPYPPDALWSYELGSKHDLADGRLRLEASLFHVAWNNGPSAFNYNANSEHYAVPGTAVSNGFSFTGEALVTEHVKAALSVAYTDAHVTQTSSLSELVFVRKGTALGVSPWNVFASVEREFSFEGKVTASIRVEDAYRRTPGPTYAPLGGNTTIDPSMNVLNLRAAVRWSSFELAAFLSNALGSHPVMTGSGNGVDNGGLNQAVTLVPRTLSVSGTWRF